MKHCFFLLFALLAVFACKKEDDSAPPQVQPVVITVQPQNTGATNGDHVYFNITAQNAATYQWQWSSDNAAWHNPGIGGTSQQYDCGTVDTSLSGTYVRCIVSNSLGSVTSNTVVLTVVAALPVTITTHPQDQTGNVGSMVTFTIVASNAANYVWQCSLDNISWINFDGQPNTPNYTIGSLTVDKNWYVRCIASNSINSVTSNSARIIVIAPVPQ